MSKKCTICSKKIPYRIFINGQQKILRNRTQCLECLPFNSIKLNSSSKEHKIFYVSEWRRNAKLELIKYKGGRCSICGYDKPIPNSYSFHHRDENTKSFNISAINIKSIKRLKQEADKCDLLCQNCHAEIHAKQFAVQRENTIKKLFPNGYQPRKNIIQKNNTKRILKEKRKCQDCDSVISNSKRCKKCHSLYLKSKSKLKIKKEELIALIQTMPIVEIGKMFNVSDTAIRKYCKNLKIDYKTLSKWSHKK
jgi:hypothetical protein